MVVDDVEDVRTSAADILRAEGYAVIEANDGQAAMELLDTHKVSVLVLDVRMPRRDGVSVIDALEEPPAVVLISAYCMDPETMERIRTKVSTFLKKPFAPLRLVEAVDEASHSSNDGGD